MMNLHRYFLTLVAAPLAALMICACTSRDTGGATSNYNLIMDNDSIPEVIKNIVRAVHDNNPSLFAMEVGYPLQRPYPLKDINNEEEMKAYYNVIMDDSLRNVILNSSPEDWQRYGWRGYGLKDGSYLWVDDNIYAIDYVSQKEKALIDSLNIVEKNRLPGMMSEGWQPVLTLLSNDDGKIYRIDTRTDDRTKRGKLYRLSIYDSHDPLELLKMPVQMLDGYSRIEGSMPVISYVFHDNEGKEYSVYPDDPVSGSPLLSTPEGDAKEVEKAYWYELFQ